MEEFGATEYIKRDISTSLNTVFKKASKEEKEMMEGWFKPLENNEYSDVLSGKNLIFIQAESLTNKAIDPVLTPTLYKMTQEGIYFDNFYAPLYPANTNDSEFIFQTGLMPSIEGATTSYKCDENFFPYSLASLFKKEGYNANSYHSFFGDFYNRNVMHETLGFDNFYSVEDLLNQHEEELKGGNFWVDDLELVKAYEENAPEEPYYSFIITASGHMPYSEERKGLEEKFEIVKEHWRDKYNDEIAYYEATQMLLDDALKYLVEQNPDTVIIIVGDHYPYGLSEESQELFLEKEFLHVPFIIYNSGLEAKTFSQVRSSFDVFPTISNLFGLKTPISFGVDALSEQKSTVYLKEGTIITDDYVGAPSKMEAWEVGKLILSTNFFIENSNMGY